ncbi:MAG: acylphosphatase [Candidatus Paceibacterota bacterium]
MDNKARAHIFVSGRVQGVRFRESTYQKAQKLGVFGWVKNLPDGRVEIVSEGDEKDVQKLIKWAKGGPIFAKVNNIEVIQEEYNGEFSSFEIRYDI